MSNIIKYETPEIEVTRFEVFTSIMDDDRNDPTVYFPEDGPLSCPDLEIPSDDDIFFG